MTDERRAPDGPDEHDAPDGPDEHDAPDAPDEHDPADALEALLAEHRDAPEAEEEEAEFDPFAPIQAGGEAGPEAGDGEAGEAGDDLPDAPLFALLRTVERDVGIERIDRIWVFPPRRLQAGETSVVVVAAYPDAQEDRRRVYAAHYTAHEEASEPRLALDEYGTAPTDRVGRLVEEVVERLKEDPAGAPRSHPIEGRDDRWHTVLHELADAHLAEMAKNPRLRRG